MKKRVISLMTSILMIIAMMASTVSLAATGDTGEATTYDITLHKIVMDSLEGWPKEKNKDGTYPGVNEGTKYDGSAITDIAGYFGAGARTLQGVHFEIYAAGEDGDATGPILKEGKTKADGTIDFTGLDAGNYVIKENTEKTKLEGQDAGKTISAQAAVPVKVTLPVYKADGTTFTTIADSNQLHVYPKNTTTDKPDVKKEIDDENRPGETGLPETPTEDPSETNPNKPVDYTVGDAVPYKITTVIKPGAKYKTAYWYDKMTEGLTFTQTDLDNMKITIGGVDAASADYTKTLDGNGFKVELTEAGLAKINDKTEEVEVVLTYTATLNSAAVVEIPESNDITFHYGNNPGKGNTPIPTKPSEGEITVNKTWADGIQLPENGIEVEFTLYNAQTGEVVKVDDTQVNPVKIQATTVKQISHTWTGLDDDTEYKVVETYKGYEAEYGTTEGGGVITVKNHKTDNPEPINPKEPKVVTYGKKFVKTNQDGTERLAGAQFIIKDPATNKYLKMKSVSQNAQAQTDLNNAKKALDDAIKAYNDRTDADDETALLEAVVNAQEAYDKAFIEAKTGYEWIDAADKNEAITKGAHVLISNSNGQIEIKGLKAGDYQLIEIVAPKGYAELKNPVDFKVGEGSSKGQLGEDDKEHINYTPDNEGIQGQKVINMKVDIPQTGGMGTILFTVVGLALMTVAFIALRKRNNEQ